ncbi:MBL fold metallo-hydrolase [Dyella sp.]|jgi:glyoxylase-like metal-dependent hydrolase (beta-lactamase superfamily II)|uniref:MBL fold metallo-hydrolase n=1 Tax=Dyella sp. TaxID=1869338 RepID=UPI002D769D86|nr:MBL fold metallo-hydrolase [Dyella sp.]HET6433577.1 MBL fold metallo-hydrolase [Dyella sp.]
MMQTRTLIRSALMAALVAGAGLALAPVETAQAAAPMVKTSAPGYYRVMLGDFEVTALSDGTVDLPVDQLLMNTTPAAVDKALAASFEKSPLETSVNAYLINTGDKLVLIDTGAGTLFGPTLGKLLDSLRASGYQPEQVDEIVITHMHPDHVGGLIKDGEIAFPNAVVRADKRDADFWLSKANLDKAAEADKGFFQGAMASLNPYVEAHRFQPFEGATEIVPGIRAVSTPGHTPGHTSYLVESNGKKLMIWGDLVHVQAVQFAQPSVTIHFDSTPAKAEAERKAEFARAAKQGYLVADAHIAFPGLGHVRSKGAAYEWVPVNYTNIR